MIKFALYSVTLGLTMLGSATAGLSPDPLSTFRFHLVRADSAAADLALEDPGVDSFTRYWLRARLHAAQGNSQLAAEHFAHAAKRAVSRRGDPVDMHLLRQFERDRLAFALGRGDFEAASFVHANPLASPDPRDPLWAALGGWQKTVSGNPKVGLAEMDAAWFRASAVWKEDAIFAQRALLRLEEDPETAANAFIDWSRKLRDGRALQRSRSIWETNPELALAALESGRADELQGWLLRSGQRRVLLRLAEEAFRREPTSERGLLLAEQFYRLREHAALENLLGRLGDLPATPEQAATREGFAPGLSRRAGERAKAAAAFDKIAEKYPATARAAEALWESAWMYELEGELEIARERFLACATHRLAGRWQQPAALRVLWLDHVMGEDPARSGLHRQLNSGWQEDAALWLLSRAALEAGEAEEGRAHLVELLERSPYSPFLNPPAVPLDPPAIFNSAEAMRALRARSFEGIAAVLGIRTMPEDIASAAVAYRHGLVERADRELDLIRRNEPSNTDLWWICRLAAQEERPTLQARAGVQLRGRLAGREGIDRVWLDRLAHPVAFSDEFLAAAAEQDLDPSYLWALCRRESLYEAEILSVAGAVGLMQLMPETAARMAFARGLPRPELGDLVQPPINLSLGSLYLGGLMREFDGDIYSALSAYNAGEGPAALWAQRRRPGSPPVEGIFQISYTETRAYVFHILRFARLYQTLWGPSAGS